MSKLYEHYLKIQKISESFTYADIDMIANTGVHVILHILSLNWMHGIGLREKCHDNRQCKVSMAKKWEKVTFVRVSSYNYYSVYPHKPKCILLTF